MDAVIQPVSTLCEADPLFEEDAGPLVFGTDRSEWKLKDNAPPSNARDVPTIEWNHGEDDEDEPWAGNLDGAFDVSDDDDDELEPERPEPRSALVLRNSAFTDILKSRGPRECPACSQMFQTEEQMLAHQAREFTV